MTLSGYLFAAITRPRFSGPIGILAIGALCWWALISYRLVGQFDARAPSTLSLSEAVKASKEGEVYVRIQGAALDCTKVIHWNFGTGVAMVDAKGQVAALAHFEECPAGRVEGSNLEGVFLEPPYGLYGEAVARGWDVTPGHLAFFEPDLRRSRAWTRIGIALFAVPLVVGCFVAGLQAERRKERRQAWRLRALGLGLMAALAWFSYYAHEYVVFGVVPATLFVAIGAAVSLAFVIVPESAVMKQVAQRLLPNDET
jgi:hypothetical protein